MRYLTKSLFLLLLIIIACGPEPEVKLTVEEKKCSENLKEKKAKEIRFNLQSRIPKYNKNCTREQKVFAQTWIYVVENNGFVNTRIENGEKKDTEVNGRKGLIWLEKNHPISDNRRPRVLYKQMDSELILIIENWVAKDPERLDNCAPKLLSYWEETQGITPTKAEEVVEEKVWKEEEW